MEYVSRFVNFYYFYEATWVQDTKLSGTRKKLGRFLYFTSDYWSVAVLTVTEYFIYFHFWFFFQIDCFLH